MEKINKNYLQIMLIVSIIFAGSMYRSGLNNFVSYLMLIMVVFCVVFITYKEVYLKISKN